MARIEWVKQRLENWARWSAQREAGGLGFPKQSAFVRLAAHGTRAEAVIPIDNVEASITDDAIQALRLSHSHLHLTLTCVYLMGRSQQETANHLGVVRSTVIAHLARADAQLAVWFRDRAERQQRGFTA